IAILCLFPGADRAHYRNKLGLRDRAAGLGHAGRCPRPSCCVAGWCENGARIERYAARLGAGVIVRLRCLKIRARGHCLIILLMLMNERVLRVRFSWPLPDRGSRFLLAPPGSEARQ